MKGAPHFGPSFPSTKGMMIPKGAKVTKCQRFGNNYTVYSWWQNDEFYCVAVVKGPAGRLYQDSNIPLRAYKKQGKRIGSEIATDTSKKHTVEKGSPVMTVLHLYGPMVYQP